MKQTISLASIFVVLHARQYAHDKGLPRVSSLGQRRAQLAKAALLRPLEHVVVGNLHKNNKRQEAHQAWH